jgi:imidazoleglycerol phosphate synthase glutamine amidotransferase subunit HisH
MQTLFESSEENPGVAGLGVLPGGVKRFPESKGFAVPNINWSGVAPMLRLGYWAWESWEVDFRVP